MTFARLLQNVMLPAALLLASCQHSQKADPTRTALAFLTAIQNSDYQQAQQFATRDSKSLLEALASFQKMLPDTSLKRFQSQQFQVRQVALQVDTLAKDTLAVVTYVSNIDTSEKSLKLRMQDGQWKVAFTRENVLPNLNKSQMPSDSTGVQP